MFRIHFDAYQDLAHYKTLASSARYAIVRKRMSALPRKDFWRIEENATEKPNAMRHDAMRFLSRDILNNLCSPM